MCSWCNVTESFCFCGTSLDPDGNSQPCEVKNGSAGTCSRCNHEAKAVPADTSSQGSDYVEF